MTFLNRTIISIVRNKGRTVILFLIITVLGILATSSLVIREACANTESAFLDKAGSLINVKYMLMDDLTDIYSWSKEEKNQEETFEFYYKSLKDVVNNSDYVKDYSYSLYMFNYTECLSNSSDYSIGMFNTDYMNRILVFGVDKTSFIDLQSYDINLTEGRSFSKKEIENGEKVCIINEDLYKYDEDGNQHDIAVGDKINVEIIVFEGTNSDLIPAKNKEIERRNEELTVIGKFHSNSEEDCPMSFEKRIYVPNKTVRSFYSRYKTMENKYNIYKGKLYQTIGAYGLGMTNVIIQTDTYADAWFLYQEIDNRLAILNKGPNNLRKETINGKTEYIAETLYYKAVRSTDAFTNVSWVLKSLDDFSRVLINVSIVAFSVIMSLITGLFIKNRKEEIGIFLSLGVKKLNIIFQIVLETLIIGALSVGLSATIGCSISKPISNKMLNSYLQTEHETGTTDNTGNLIKKVVGFDEEEIAKMYEIHLTAKDVVQIMGTELTVILVSSGITVYYITKLKPKEVLLG